MFGFYKSREFFNQLSKTQLQGEFLFTELAGRYGYDCSIDS